MFKGGKAYLCILRYASFFSQYSAPNRSYQCAVHLCFRDILHSLIDYYTFHSYGRNVRMIQQIYEEPFTKLACYAMFKGVKAYLRMLCFFAGKLFKTQFYKKSRLQSLLAMLCSKVLTHFLVFYAILLFFHSIVLQTVVASAQFTRVFVLFCIVLLIIIHFTVSGRSVRMIQQIYVLVLPFPVEMQGQMIFPDFV